MASEWQAAEPESTPLRKGEVHLWAWELDGSRAREEELLKLLSEDERVRNAQLRFARDRHANLVARATLRRILGSCLSVAPDKIRFAYSRFGRPSIAPTDAPTLVPRLEFNLSHTPTLAVAAIAWDLRLGVDIEAVHPIELDVAQAVFSSRELKTLQSLAPEEVLGGFYRCWTRKEAISKAEGLGLNMDLPSFSVSLGPTDSPRILETGGALSCKWLLQDLPAIPGVIGALAISESPERVRCFRLS